MNQAVVGKLREVLGPDHLLLDPADLLCYSYDASGLESLPQAVVLPVTTRQVAAVLSIASENSIPVFPRGAGSGTAGASIPQGDGIAVVLTAMDRILDINVGNLSARVQPGVITGEFQEAVSRMGLFYPPDPASLAFCTLGGNVNTGAGGARAVKYGVTRDYVTALEVVLPGGRVMKTGPDTAKGVAGYDLTRLMVGSEGTLGIVTGITLKLLPDPQATGTALVFFPQAAGACCAVREFFENRVLPRCAEFLDESSIGCIGDLLPVSLPESCGAMLLVEVDGSQPSIKPQLDIIEECCMRCGATGIRVASSPLETGAFWKARRSLSPAIRRLGYSGKISEDICVPRQDLPHMVERLRVISEEHGIKVVVFGHAGDGNLHVNLLFDRDDRDAAARTERCVACIMEAAVEAGGTVSGEHGIGLAKKKFMSLEVGTERLELMRGIKRVFDPEGIMNPGKVLPDIP